MAKDSLATITSVSSQRIHHYLCHQLRGRELHLGECLEAINIGQDMIK